MNFMPKKKAVIVGINYIETEGIALRGCANDAKLMALTLVSHFDFNTSDILFLTDSEPDKGYDTLIDSNETVSFYDNWPRDEIPPTKHHDSRIYPNKRNILTAINWLTRDAQPGDILIFYFAGHGVQVDVLTSYEGEGYDEALLPADSTLYLASNGSDLDEYNVLLCSELKELLLSVPSEAQLNIILDCNGGQTILDPAGNINGLWYIKGVVTKGIWPFLSATSKVKRAQYNSSVFKDERMIHRLVRPRYVPCIQIASTSNLKDPSLQSTQYVSLSCKGYCFSAAPWGEIAAEASLPLLSVSRKTQLTNSYNNNISTMGESKLGVIEIPISRGGAYNIVHGVFTWSFCKAISDIATGILQQGRPRNELSFKTIMARTKEYIKCVKSSILPTLDQIPELTIHSGGGGTISEYFCTPFGGDKNINFDYDYYFKITDNCISHLKKSQNFLTPQEAYNSMLQSTKNDTLLFNSVNINPQSIKINTSDPSNPISNKNSPPTFRKEKEINQNIINSNDFNFVQSNNIKNHQIIDTISNENLNNFKDDILLPPSSVDLLPPTPTLFNSVYRNDNFKKHLNNTYIQEYQSEKEPHLINQTYTDYNSNNYFNHLNYQDLHSGYDNQQSYINLNKLNPYFALIDQNSSKKNNENNNEFKPIKGIMLSNPIQNHSNQSLKPSFNFIQQQQNPVFIRPFTTSLSTKDINNNLNNHNLNNQYIGQVHPNIPTSMTNIPPTPPISSYRSSQNFGQIQQTITYPPLAFQSINKHMVLPVRSLPSSNNFYPTSQTRHVTGPSSNSVLNERVRHDYVLQNYNEYNSNAFPSNQSNSHHPVFVNYPVLTQPLNMYNM